MDPLRIHFESVALSRTRPARALREAAAADVIRAAERLEQLAEQAEADGNARRAAYYRGWLQRTVLAPLPV